MDSCQLIDSSPYYISTKVIFYSRQKKNTKTTIEKRERNIVQDGESGEALIVGRKGAVMGNRFHRNEEEGGQTKG